MAQKTHDNPMGLEPWERRPQFKSYENYFNQSCELNRWRSLEDLPQQMPRVPNPRELQAQHNAIIAAAREEGAQAERARIMGKLEALKPTETQYTRIQWRWEEKGAQAMWDKMMKAISA